MNITKTKKTYPTGSYHTTAIALVNQWKQKRLKCGLNSETTTKPSKWKLPYQLFPWLTGLPAVPQALGLRLRLHVRSYAHLYALRLKRFAIAAMGRRHGTEKNHPACVLFSYFSYCIFLMRGSQNGAFPFSFPTYRASKKAWSQSVPLIPPSTSLGPLGYSKKYGVRKKKRDFKL